MAKITRVFQKIFGGSASAAAGGISKFGSLAAGSPVFTTDPTTIQSLVAFLNGWTDAIEGANSPAIEDMNALFFLAFRQIAYLLQNGIPEWDADTVYYAGSLVTSSANIYVSKTDNNTNNIVIDTANWAIYGSRIRASTGTTNTLSGFSDDIYYHNGGHNQIVELPLAADFPAKKFVIKYNAVDAFSLTVTATGGNLIDGSSTVVLAGTSAQRDSITIISNGTGWMIV